MGDPSKQKLLAGIPPEHLSKTSVKLMVKHDMRFVKLYLKSQLD